MNPTNISSLRSPRRNALLVLGCTLSLVLLPLQALQAAPDAPAATTVAAPTLPLSHSLAKVTGGEKGPFVLTLKNDSKAAVTVHAKILLAVAFHAESKAKNLPAQKIDAGHDWKIADLAAEDKVILTAEGFAPQTIVIK